jgi:histidinol phosphatase-like PHP family hydrolase
MKPYLYETHLHTSPVSKCARADVRETLAFYKSLGYEGVFITNHFLDGNINIDRSLPYAERIEFYFSDYEEGVRIGKEMGISVFFGVECSYGGTDFLVYGLDKQWFLSHPEIEDMRKTQMLPLMAQDGALIIQAHPFREASYIDHIRLFPRSVHGVETYNACRTDFENTMAELYAKNYGLLSFAGSDNHSAGAQTRLGGMQSQTPIADEMDFVARVKNGEIIPFSRKVTE